MAAPDVHLTVWVAGFPAWRCRRNDDLDAGKLADLVGALRAAPPVAPALWVGGAAVRQGNVWLDVHAPGDGLGRLRSRIGGADAELRWAPYAPHITVGGFTRAWPTVPIARAVGRLRALPLIGWRPRALELVTLDATRQHSPLRQRAQVLFAGESP